MLTISTATGSGTKVRIILWLAICSILATGCGPTMVTYDNLGALNKGMERARAQEALPIRPQESRTLTVGGRMYVVDIYPLMTAGTRTQSSYGTTVGASIAVALTNDLYMLYQNDRLRYWGMMGDYSKTEDLQIAEIAPELYNMLIDKK